MLLAACGGGSSSSPGTPDPAPPPPPASITVIDVSQPWVTATPASVSMDEVRLNRGINDLSGMPRVRSVLVARHGKLIAQNYLGGSTQATRFDLRSVTKSVVSMLTAIAIAQGDLSGLDATVGDHLGTPYVQDAGDRAVTVRQMLTMTSRYQWNESNGDDYNRWIVTDDHVQYLLDRSQTASADFEYNSALVHMLGVVLEHATSQKLPQFAQEALFDRLGITSVEWEALDAEHVNGGSGIRMTAEDLLRFGQWILQKGNSGRAQIVTEEWVREATTPKFNWRNTYNQQRSTTYGYLWWVADAPAVPAAFAWGYGGQFVYVAPSLDMVIVVTTDWVGMSAETNPSAFAGQILSIIASDILPAAR